ncbi:MAG: trypsin-like peptidase domain-containing protein [Planctomycetes bacterium]|nr:trypsin-like peptidase domain-containing protein [Planctomycetota bacterium]
MSGRRALVATLVLALAAACGGPAPKPLSIEAPFDGVLDLAKRGEARFVLDVPKDLVRLELELTSEDADLDLALAPPGDPEDEHVLGCDAGSARYTLDRTSEPPLEEGAWSVRVTWPLRSAPRGVRHALERIRYAITPRAFRARVDGVLAPGIAVEGAVERDSGGFRLYTIDVPDAATALRVDVLDTPGDLDLAVGRGPVSAGLGADEALAQNMYGKESIVLRREGESALTSGTWFVQVFDAHDAESPIPFRLRARFDAEPATDQLELPRSFATSEDAALGFPLAAVVEIETEEGGGSGTLLTEDGWILTNHHVVLLRDQSTAREAIVSMTLDAARPPVELFRAKVEDSDADLDLALLRVTAGLHGQALPSGYRFPRIELGSASTVRAGASLRIAGFPDTGGLGTRVTITLTQGIVAGFDALPAGRVVKTDAEITSGNSGGAALDGAGKLVGVPTSRVEHGSGQLGYVHPIEWVPLEWLQRMGLARR